MSWKPRWSGRLLPLPSYDCFSEGSSCSEQVTASASARLNLSLKPLLPGVCLLNLCSNFFCAACLAKSIKNWTCRTGQLILCFCWSNPCFWVWQICGIKEIGRFKTALKCCSFLTAAPSLGCQQVCGPVTCPAVPAQYLLWILVVFSVHRAAHLMMHSQQMSSYLHCWFEKEECIKQTKLEN